jgi:hypothetical protein
LRNFCAAFQQHKSFVAQTFKGVILLEFVVLVIEFTYTLWLHNDCETVAVPEFTDLSL